MITFLDMSARAEQFTLELSNDFAGIVTDTDGSGGNYSECQTTAILLLGSEDITSQATFDVIASDGVTGNVER